MLSSLQGKSAIVTGSTSGIGLGIARSLAGAGVNIVLNGFGPRDEIDRIRLEIEERYGVKVLYSAADMSSPSDIAKMMDEALSHFGPIEILINNAGIQHVEAIETFPPEKWNAILSINLSAAFHTMRLALPGMRKTNWGGSSTSRRPTAWSLLLSNPLTSLRSTAFWG